MESNNPHGVRTRRGPRFDTSRHRCARSNTLRTAQPTLNNQKESEIKKEIEYSDKIDELNQETDSLLEEIDKWQMLV